MCINLGKLVPSMMLRGEGGGSDRTYPHARLKHCWHSKLASEVLVVVALPLDALSSPTLRLCHLRSPDLLKVWWQCSQVSKESQGFLQNNIQTGVY